MFLAIAFVALSALPGDVATPPPDPIVTPADTDQIFALFKAHQWVPFAALVIMILIRLQKADRLPGLNWIPAKDRPFLALGLGIASGVLNKIAVDSKSWPVAVFDGLLSALIAITTHDTVIESIRGGKEIGGGGAKNPDPNAVPTSPDAIAKKDIGTKIVGAIGILLIAFGAKACLTPAQVSKGGLVIGKIGCVIEHAYLDDAALNSLCDLFTPEEKEAGKQTAAAHRLAVTRDAKAHAKAEVCTPDGGAQ